VFHTLRDPNARLPRRGDAGLGVEGRHNKVVEGGTLNR